MMTEKRFTRIVDHTQKEVRIFDEIINKNVFNIFFTELDSAICLNGALTEVVDLLNYYEGTCLHYEKKMSELQIENEQLKKQKPFLKIHDDYFIQYGDEGELFSMHKPSNIRSLMHILNRENGYSELQCEYNDLEME